MADTAQLSPVMTIAQANALLTAPGAKFEMEEKAIGSVKLRTYKNAPLTIRDLVLNSVNWGEREFLVYQDERVTFSAHYKAVARFATLLRDQYGVKKGDRIAVIMRNYPQWPVAFFGALTLGAIATPMNSWWTGEELEYGLSDSGAKVAVIDIERLERLREHLPRLTALKHVIVARGLEEEADPRVESMDKLIGEPTTWAGLPDTKMPDAEVGPDDDATIMYTSGTTGKPKGALATHRACNSNVFNGLSCQARGLIRYGDPVPVRDPKVDPPRIPLLAIPFFHATGAFANLLPAIMNADKIVTMYKWDAGEALKIIEREKITVIGGVPAIAWQVLEHPDRDKYDLSSILAVSYGGAPAAPELVATIKRRFPDGAASNGWGMTETCATSCVNFGKDYELRPESCGARRRRWTSRLSAARARRSGPMKWASCGPRAPTSPKRTGTNRKPPPRRSSTVGSSPATSAASMRRASSSCSTAPRTC